MAKRSNTFTRFIEDIVDDTKDLFDDLVDRAKDLETDVRHTARNTIDDDEASSADVADLQRALAELTAKVNQLAELQLASASAAGSSTNPATKPRSSAA